MKAWFPVRQHDTSYNKVGVITDVYDEYVELQEEETGEYFIRHVSLIHKINERENL